MLVMVSSFVRLSLREVVSMADFRYMDQLVDLGANVKSRDLKAQLSRDKMTERMGDG